MAQAAAIDLSELVSRVRDPLALAIGEAGVTGSVRRVNRRLREALPPAGLDASRAAEGAADLDAMRRVADPRTLRRIRVADGQATRLLGVLAASGGGLVFPNVVEVQVDAGGGAALGEGSRALLDACGRLFPNLGTLVLELRGAKLGLLGEGLKSCARLREVRLSGVDGGAMPPDLWSLPAATTISISGQRNGCKLALPDVGPHDAARTRLRHLRVAGFWLCSRLPDSLLGDLRSLRRLELVELALRELPGPAPPRLEELHLVRALVDCDALHVSLMPPVKRLVLHMGRAWHPDRPTLVPVTEADREKVSSKLRGLLARFPGLKELRLAHGRSAWGHLDRAVRAASEQLAKQEAVSGLKVVYGP